MEIREYLKESAGEIKSALERLVKIPSVSTGPCGNHPFGNECAAVLDEFLAIAEENGFTAKNYGYYAGSADLLPEGEAKLGILAHLDVVPVSEKDWSFPPFEMTEKNGKLYGRGCEDDKGPLVAALFAMKAVRECGFKLKRNVRLIAGCSEETGSETDIREYMKRAPMPENVFTPDAEFPVITTEKGMLRFSFGGDADCGVIKSIKGGTVVNAVPSEVSAVLDKEIIIPQNENIDTIYENGSTTVVCKGKSAHASTPEQGINAFNVLFKVLLKYADLPENDKNMINRLLRLFPDGETDATALGLSQTDNSGSTTCVFSIISFEEGRLSCKADMRFPVAFSKGEAVEKIKDAVEKAGFEFFGATGSEPHCVDENGDFVKNLLQSYTEVTGKPGYCKAIGGGTYVHGIDGGVAFGMEIEGEDNHIHGADEWISMDALLTSSEIFANAIVKICG